MQAFILILLMLVSSPALAAEQSPVKLSVSTGVVWGIQIPSGASLPPRQALGFSVLVPTKQVALIGDVGFTTSFTSFGPSPTFIFGCAKRLNGHFGLGGSVVYVLLPPYDNSSLAHLLGASLVPSVQVSDHATMLMPIGPTYNVSADTWSWTIAVKFILNP